MPAIAVLNAGSSSIKFAHYELAQKINLLYRGLIEKIGIAPHLKMFDAQGQLVVDRALSTERPDHAAATAELIKVWREVAGHVPISGVGHRVVHGGLEYAAPVRIDSQVLDRLAQLEPLAPLHQPHNLAPIRAILERAPDLRQVACFDTAFHRSQAPLTQEFPIPREFTEEGVRRYGFHGLSYEFIIRRLTQTAPSIARSRLVIAHLGNGASLCATKDGLSVATTMGFTAVDGLMMGTRCGSIDPGVLIYLMDRHQFDARALENFVYRRSGLLGVSGISSDMRTLRRSDKAAAKEAIALFTYRIIREIGSLAAALGGLDAIVFTGGIGENDPETRSEVAAGCRWLGLDLDETRNRSGDSRISSDRSTVSAWVIPTDEEQMIALQTTDVLGISLPAGASG